MDQRVRNGHCNSMDTSNAAEPCWVNVENNLYEEDFQLWDFKTWRLNRSSQISKRLHNLFICLLSIIFAA